MSTTFGYPGIYTSEQLAPISAPYTTFNSPSVAGFMGEWWKGPTTPVLCNSWNDFVNAFGGFNSANFPVYGVSATPTYTLTDQYLGYSVYEFFANGGQTCWVYRLVNGYSTGTSGSSASASYNLLSQQATPQITGTLQVGALGVPGNPGVWGNSVYVQVSYSANNSGTTYARFNINIYYNPGGSTVGGNWTPYLVESWTDLSMLPNDPRYFLTLINSGSTGSKWVVATDNLLSSQGVAAPYNTPVAAGPVAFTGGVNPSAAPIVSDYIAALTYGRSPTVSPINAPAPFDQVPGVLNLNLPGFSWDNGASGGSSSMTSVITQAATYAATRPYTFLVVDPPIATTPANLLGSGGFASTVAAGTGQSSYVAVYYPWITAPNPASTSFQNTINLPPGGYVLGQMTSTDTTVGPWVAPAGNGTILNNAANVERTFAPSELSALTTANINALKKLPTGAIIIFGTRTQNQATGAKYVPVRRTLNYIEASLNSLLQFALFQPNGPALWSLISTTCNQFLGGMAQANAFPSNSPNSSYYVICDSTVNTPQTIAQGIVNTKIGVALLYPAEFINITISQFQNTGATTVTTAASNNTAL